MRYHVRCKKCEARQVFRVKPDEMYRWSVKQLAFVNKQPVCESCGHNEYRLDTWMNSRDTRATACSCSGYMHMTRREWPHRIGSPYCWYRKNGTMRMHGDADFKDFQLEQLEGNTNELV